MNDALFRIDKEYHAALDLLLPSKGRQSRNGIPILSPRKQHKQDVDDCGYYADHYPTESTRYPLFIIMHLALTS